MGSVEKLGSTWRGKFEGHQDSVKLRRPCLKARLFKWSCKAGKKKKGGGEVEVPHIFILYAKKRQPRNYALSSYSSKV